MALSVGTENCIQRRDEWIKCVNKLVDQIESWAKVEGWAAIRGLESVTEDPVGAYDVPVLTVRFGDGEVHIRPVAFRVVGADGRVDLEAYPQLNRVRLLRQGDKWEIITDSNVPIRLPWKAKTFVQLARDLVA